MRFKECNKGKAGNLLDFRQMRLAVFLVEPENFNVVPSLCSGHRKVCLLIRARTDNKVLTGADR